MKKYLVAIALLAIFVGVVYAENSSVAYRGFDTIPDRFGGVVTLPGKTPRTTSVNVDNVVRTIDNIVVSGSGTYLGGSDNTLTPIAAWVTCNTNATRWAFQATPSATFGQYVAGDTIEKFSGPDAIGYLKGIAAGASDNNACAITLWY